MSEHFVPSPVTADPRELSAAYAVGTYFDESEGLNAEPEFDTVVELVADVILYHSIAYPGVPIYVSHLIEAVVADKRAADHLR
jgi:hypothetical protein